MRKNRTSRHQGLRISTRKASASAPSTHRKTYRVSAKDRGRILNFEQGTATRFPHVSDRSALPTIPNPISSLADETISPLRTIKGRKRGWTNRQRPSHFAQKAEQAVSSSTTSATVPLPRRSIRISERLKLSTASSTLLGLRTSNASTTGSISDVSSEAESRAYVDMHIYVTVPGRPSKKVFRRGALDTGSDFDLIPEDQLPELGLSGQIQGKRDMLPVRIRTIAGESSVITPKGFVFIEWHMHGHSNTTYRKKFYVLPSEFKNLPFDCLIGRRTIFKEKFLLRNGHVLFLGRA